MVMCEIHIRGNRVKTTLGYYSALFLQLSCDTKLVQNRNIKIFKGKKYQNISQGKCFANKCKPKALQHVKR